MPRWWPSRAKRQPRGSTRKRTSTWISWNCSGRSPKYAVQVIEPETIPEVVRKAFKQAQSEKPGVSFIDLPENIAQADVPGKVPLPVLNPPQPIASPEIIERAARIIREAKYPLVMAGNGVIRARAADSLRQFAERLNIPVANTFMAKGVVPFSHPLWLGAVGLQAHDYVSCGFDRADVIVSVGYDMVEYHPNRWNPTRSKQIVHIDSTRPKWTSSTFRRWKWWAPSTPR